METVEIIVTGNEVLNGDVLDTNSHWLCQRLTGMGATVTRVVQVRDDVAVIAGEIQAALARHARLVFTIGGLGPTDDDRTLAAIATATGHPLALDSRALAIVTARYQAFAAQGFVADAAITPARQKMAIIPAGAEPLANPVGAAPPVILPVNAATIIALPAVPTELRSIVEGLLVPALRAILGVSLSHERRFLATSGDESVLAPLLKPVADRHPQVYVKSHAQRFGNDVRFRITLAAAGNTPASVDQALDEVQQDLSATLQAAGITLEKAQE